MREYNALRIDHEPPANATKRHDMLAMIGLKSSRLIMYKKPTHIIADGIAQDIQMVMRYLRLYVEDRFNPTEFVISGHSLGGHTSWNILADEPKIKAAIISVGCPNMHDLMVDRLGGKDVVDPIRWPGSISEYYSERDQRVSRIEGKQILILNGALDKLVPSRFSAPWVEKYGWKNDVSFNVFENSGHWFSLEMMDKVIEWVVEKIA